MSIEGKRHFEFFLFAKRTSKSVFSVVYAQVPVAEKTPRQKKRKASQEVAPLPDDEKR